MKEFNNAVDLHLSNLFSDINGIGNDLFEVLTPYIDVIKVTYINHVLNLRLTKENNWEETLEKIMSKIVKLYFTKISR